MILQLSYIAFFLLTGLGLLGVRLGGWAIIVTGIAALVIAASYIFGLASAEPGPRRWLW